MGRTPKAKQEVLDAARRIVRERGAGNLTFEELVQESGVTRGGITYHFATKDALLRALVQADMEQWRELESRHCPETVDDHTAALLTDIRGHTERNEDRRRFVTGMLSAITLDRSLLDPVREFIAQRRANVEWDDVQLRRHLLRLASEGLFWSELFGFGELEPEVRERLVALMEEMALELAETESMDRVANE